MDKKIKEQLHNLPNESGVYLMKDADGKIIYIGKAKSLKNRVKNYFQQDLHSPKIQVMVPKIDQIDFITTDNEIEALILEDTLVKKHKPKYNTLLKDDKRFPWIEITDEDYPRILVNRNPVAKSKRGKSKYFGPYVNAGSLHSTIDFLKQIFPLKQCRNPVFKNKPCMNYHINRCSGPCQKLISPDEYKQLLKQIELFLAGKQSELLDKLKMSMEQASKKLEYEKAAKYRDTIKAIENIIGTQKIVSDDYSIEQDILSFASEKNLLAIILLRIREGKLVYKESFDFIINELDTPEETFWAFLEHYYQTIESEQVPKEIITPYIPNESDIIAALLTEKKGTTVKLTVPKTGKKLDILQMAFKNAQIALNKVQQENINKVQDNWNEVATIIQNKLQLDKFPSRIECFDISHISGTNTVASMVVFINGKPCKSDYRKFKIKTTDGIIDDFAAMKEVIQRRYARILKEQKPLPDLIIVDGGKGQLSSALKALKELDLIDQPIAALAKRFEEVFIPEEKVPRIFDNNSPALYLFQQIRDEAHRFAISFHRDLRSKKMVASSLDAIKSVGKIRKARLIKHFGSVDKIYKAEINELSQVEGISAKLAEQIYKELH